VTFLQLLGDVVFYFFTKNLAPFNDCHIVDPQNALYFFEYFLLV